MAQVKKEKGVLFEWESVILYKLYFKKRTNISLCCCYYLIATEVFNRTFGLQCKKQKNKNPKQTNKKKHNETSHKSKFTFRH